MSFRERSAWVMAALTAAAGLYYLGLLVSGARALGHAPPPLGLFVPYVILIVAGSVVVQVVLAIASPREAAAPADERERLVIGRAGHWSGKLLGAGAALSLLAFLVRPDGNLLFHLLLGSLILSQVAEYALQGALLRRGG